MPLIAPPRLLALSILAFHLRAEPALSAALDEHAHRLAHDIFRQLVEINTTDSVGSVTAAATLNSQVSERVSARSSRGQLSGH
jgi:hypothetical protein